MTGHVTRARVVDAVVHELDARGRKAASDPLSTGRAVADRLGLRRDTPTDRPPAPESWPHRSTLEIDLTLHAGIWLRLGSRPRPEQVIGRLDHVVIPLHSGERGPIHVGPSLRAWCEEVRAAGVHLWAMDWLPRASRGTAHVGALCDAARALGCVGIEADCEPDAGWRGAVHEAMSYRLALARHRGDLDLAITDYGRGGIGERTLSALLDGVDGHRPIGVPQSYDPRGTYAADYHERSVAYWREVGAERVVLGVGAWLRGERRHRTPAEMRRHLEHVPADVLGVRAWYATASRLDDGDEETADDLLPVLSDLAAPAVS